MGMSRFPSQSPYPMIAFEEAMAILETHIAPLPPRPVPLEDVSGLVLAEDIRAAEDLPGFAASTMDGYAVIAEDATEERQVLGEQEAGATSDLVVREGTCLRIMTGAPLPAGADAVVPVEQTCEENGRMILQADIEAGQHVRPVGADVAAGQLVVPRDTVMGPAELGLLATLGITAPIAYPRPRVAVLATGDELVPAEEDPPAGKIRDSNSYMLAAALHELGCDAFCAARIADSRQALTQALEDALQRADLVLTTGGVSMGTHDLVKPVLESMGTVHFGRVAIQPGKPLTFATVKGVPVIGLPGNPVSTLVALEVVVRPILRKMAHLRVRYRPERSVRVKHAIRHAPERLEFQRARLSCREGLWWATTTGSQSSSRLLSLVGADALLEIPRGTGGLPPGARVTAILIDEPEIEDHP